MRDDWPIPLLPCSGRQTAVRSSAAHANYRDTSKENDSSGESSGIDIALVDGKGNVFDVA